MVKTINKLLIEWDPYIMTGVPGYTRMVFTFLPETWRLQRTMFQIKTGYENKIIDIDALILCSFVSS